MESKFQERCEKLIQRGCHVECYSGGETFKYQAKITTSLHEVIIAGGMTLPEALDKAIFDAESRGLIAVSF